MTVNKNTLRVLNKLFENGYLTEKEIQGMDVKKMVHIKGITVQEIMELTNLQDAIKSNKVISYLSRDDIKEREDEKNEDREDDLRDTQYQGTY